MTKRECAIVMAYTGIATLQGDDLKYFYDYLEEILGKTTYTHELPYSLSDIEEKSKPDFICICAKAVTEKNIVDYTCKELCDEIIHRVQLYDTAITGDLVDQLVALRNIELLQKR